MCCTAQGGQGKHIVKSAAVTIADVFTKKIRQCKSAFKYGRKKFYETSPSLTQQHDKEKLYIKYMFGNLVKLFGITRGHNSKTFLRP